MNRAAYLPFGTGPQNCVGQRFAMLEMVTVVTAIARRCRQVPTHKNAEKDSATLIPDKLRMRVHPWLEI
ncbi:cytochrome P450 [Nocardia sp. NPDC052278]|uniref:cytochrome P450 n=1 Tax=unclassified Nocardia TaxID=2637762 RepID=UPI003683E20E